MTDTEDRPETPVRGRVRARRGGIVHGPDDKRSSSGQHPPWVGKPLHHTRDGTLGHADDAVAADHGVAVTWANPREQREGRMDKAANAEPDAGRVDVSLDRARALDGRRVANAPAPLDGQPRAPRLFRPHQSGQEQQDNGTTGGNKVSAHAARVTCTTT